VDKVFISKEELRSALHNTQQKAGFFTTVLAWFGIIITLLWLIPLIVFWMLLFVVCIPFYLIDTHILRRIFNG
jgi:Flp pilus assembly protein TadB